MWSHPFQVYYNLIHWNYIIENYFPVLQLSCNISYYYSCILSSLSMSQRFCGGIIITLTTSVIRHEYQPSLFLMIIPSIIRFYPHGLITYNILRLSTYLYQWILNLILYSKIQPKHSYISDFYVFTTTKMCHPVSRNSHMLGLAIFLPQQCRPFIVWFHLLSTSYWGDQSH